MPYPRIILSLAQLYRKLCCVNAFERAAKDPLGYQERLLLGLIKKNKNTKFGRAHFFERIKSVEDYQANVPIMKYDGFRDYIEEIKQGKQQILTKEDVLLFGLTSGTTGSPKYCPITQSFVDGYRRNWEIWMYNACKDHPGMFNGRIFTMISPEKEGYLSGGIPYGAISGMIVQHEPGFIRRMYAVPYVAFSIKDYEARYYTILRFAIQADITWLVTPNPSMVIMLAKKAIYHRKRIIEDIEKGTLNSTMQIDESIRKEMERFLKPDKKRADELRKQEFLPKNYWPNLSVIGCWKEGTLSIYLKLFSKYYGNAAVRDIGLISTEGHSSIPVEDDGGHGILALTNHFYEFIPVGHKIAVTCDKLEQDKEYFLVLTTAAGFYRYHTNDIVKVVGFHKKAPVIEFLHKGEHITSITGEKLTEWQVVNAVRRASHKAGIFVDSFTAVANARAARYDFLVEFHDIPKNAKILMKLVDEELMNLNIEYKSKRKSGRLKAPVMRVIRSGSYHALHKLKSANGHDAQVKIPALTDDVKFEKSLQWK